MNETVLKEKVFSEAERILMAGIQPTLSVVSEALSCDEEQIHGFYLSWWQELPKRMCGEQPGPFSDIPESLSQLMARVWQQALQEAGSQAAEVQHTHQSGVESVKREADESIQQTRRQLLDMEDKYRHQCSQNEDFNANIKGLEAEIEVLKVNLASETSQRKKEEQLRLGVEQELNLLRKTYDDSKRTFDQRIKDEQRHSLDAVSKADADVRYYRGALEKLRDEVGKKESALTKNIHDLQAEVARKEVKNDTLSNQLKKVEQELKQIKQSSTGQNRDLTKINSQLLSESNKNKRLEDQVKKMSDDALQVRQKQTVLSNEQTRRENHIREQLKQKEDELFSVVGKISDLEKKVTLQDEEIRRLNRNM